MPHLAQVGEAVGNSVGKGWRTAGGQPVRSKVAFGAVGAGLVPARRGERPAGDHKSRPYALPPARSLCTTFERPSTNTGSPSALRLPGTQLVRNHQWSTQPNMQPINPASTERPPSIFEIAGSGANSRAVLTPASVVPASEVDRLADLSGAQQAETIGAA